MSTIYLLEGKQGEMKHILNLAVNYGKLFNCLGE